MRKKIDHDFTSNCDSEKGWVCKHFSRNGCLSTLGLVQWKQIAYLANSSRGSCAV